MKKVAKNAGGEMTVSLKDEAETKANSISTTNAYFKHLIDLVPPKAYFDVECKDILSKHNLHHELSQTGTSAKVRGGTSGKNEKHLSKKAKLNPTQLTKTSELQQILPQLKESTTSAHSLTTNNNNSIAKSTNYSNGPKNSDLSLEKKGELVSSINGDVAKPKSKKHDTKLAKSTVLPESIKEADPVSVAVSNSESIENLTESSSSGDVSKRSSPGIVHARLHPDQLREKLKARILELQLKRQKGMTPEEFLESKKLRRKESKFKLKQKRKEAKKLKLSIEKQSKNSQQKLNGVSEVKPDVKGPASSNIVFSKFQFSEQAKKPKDRKVKKPKSYKELYEKVTKDKAQLDELKESNPDKAKKIAEKNAWRKAMDQSKGVKVKDNPELIKKSMKKEEKLKQRSQKKWEERTATVADQQQKRQDKRKKNILAKKQVKSERKVKLAKKKGRIVSGF